MQLKNPTTQSVLLALFLSLSTFSTFAQELDLTKKQVKAYRTQLDISIDGQLDEEDWLAAPIATGFTTLEPNPGKVPSQKTEVKILYDNSGIYIGAYLRDTFPEGIKQEISQRDNLNNTDWFGIFMDPYRDGINGVGFILTPANVQFDAKYSAFGEDEGWDAVWEGKSARVSDGWIAEFKIPYAAIRFPDKPEQTWHINFGRRMGRNQEKSFWSAIDPQQDGFLNQSGYLNGIENITSPVRLQATPFIAVYGEQHHDADASPVNTYGHSINGGMDVKYGISDAFTLDMTLIPDFGEAQSDNQVLNLSPFEVRFDENRQFFTEGTELFNKGNLFYSRRIGGTPLYRYDVEGQLEDGDEIVENPGQSQLYNATKISGRTEKGLGIGFFNATAGREYAKIENPERGNREILTNPLTNYNVLVFDQNLKNNSFATLINTTVLREGEAYDANVTGAILNLKNKGQKWGVSGSYKLSQKYFTDSTDLGHTYDINLRKLSGNFTFGLGYNEESDTYDPNDLGFLFNNNERSFDGWAEYSIYKPFSVFNRANIGIWSGYTRLFNPNEFAEWGVNMWVNAQTKGFWDLEMWTYIQPITSFDYFEARTDGRYYRMPTLNNTGFWIGSDNRKRIRVTLFGRFGNVGEKDRHNWSAGMGHRFRLNDKFNFRFDINNNFSANEVGFVNKVETESGEDDIIFGKRDRTTVENSLQAAYNFDSQMGLTFRLRHYWTKVSYNSFHTLQQDGRLGVTDYSDLHNANFNAFNIDMIYRWRFAPGSDIFLIWKNAILHSEEQASFSYLDNLDGLFKNPQVNSISLKVIYFLDYNSIVNRRSRQGRAEG